MASWKKIVVEDSTNHIAQTSALSDHMKGAAGSRSFTASPELLFQNATDTTDSFAKGTADQWLRMNNTANGLVWDTLDVAGDSGTASASTAGLAVQTGNANQIVTAGSGNTITIKFPDNVTIEEDLLINGGDSSNRGGKITFGLGETIDNDTDALVKITSPTTEVTGNLKVTGNNIQSSGGQNAITLSSDDVIINGDLTVSGSTTTVNTETINLADNVIFLNSNHGDTDAPSQDAGLTVDRGSSTDQSIFWDESADAWALGENESSQVFGTIHGYITTNQTSTSNPGGSDDGSGLGSMWLNTSDQQAFIRTA
tara:strand:- start:291 stop:1226 length:936 start_codon:yes stop_codon:yes gene_type:complete